MRNGEASPYTALIVDDDRAILEVLEEMLEEAGFATTCFSRGKPAVEALERQRFDLVVIDQWLPDMNGMYICDVAREHHGNSTAIIMLTADARIEREVLALELGADDFLGKPFHVDELLARIDAKLKRIPVTGQQKT